MIRITQLTSAKAAASYFSRSDYYDAEQLPGYWHGQLAKRLGLEGTVDRAVFEAVMDNRDPSDVSRSLTPRMRTDRRPGYDITFTVPKSVSILWALTGDERILEVFRQSVNQTLSEMEGDALVRVHQGNRMTTRRTQNLLFANFLHTTSRPVGGYADPSLHIHAVAANLTDDGRRLKAADIHLIKADAPYWQSRFHSRFAQALADLGIAIERRGIHYEIGGIDRRLIERFSARTQQIEEEARRRGVTDAKQKAELGARTREAKSMGVKPEALRMAWGLKLTDAERQHILAEAFRDSRADIEEVSRQAVTHALAHHFERESVNRERTIKATAMQFGVGRATPEAIDQELQRRALIERGEHEQRLVTTREVVQEERSILAMARYGKGDVTPLNPSHGIRRDFLTTEQRLAVRQLLTSTNRLQLLVGRAGVGKSTIASEFAEALHAAETPLVVAAPTSKAVDVLRKDGFKAVTLAKLLADEVRRAWRSD